VLSEQTIPWRREPPVVNLFLLRLQSAGHARFFKLWLRRIAPDTHQDQAISDDLLSPWRFNRPRRTLVPQRVQGVLHILVAADTTAPILSWLALQAIRFTANR
jgi:hypothetical protein